MAESKKVKELLDKANYLFYNHISNSGNLDYSEKEYGYLVEAIEDVEVGYLEDESVDSGYAQKLRDEGFSLTEQEAIQTLELRIKNIEEEVGSVKYARGGFVSKGEMVWNQWLSSKRADFLYKHFTPEITPRGQEILVGKTWNFLPRNVKNKLQSEYANVEEYAKGGGVKKRNLKSVAHLADWKGEGIKKWYLRSYPTDELGEELNDDVTFKDLWDALNNKQDVYEIMGVGDSVVRERLFEYIALIYDVDYNVVYNKWLNTSKYANGGGVGSGAFLRYEGQSILLHSVPSPEYDRFLDTEIVIEKIDNNKIVKSFVRETGEKVPFIIDDTFKKEEYAKGGGVGEYAESKFDSSVAKLREYIKKYPYIWTKNNKEYVPIEGWQFAGLILGYSTRVTEVTPTANGYMAKAEVIDGDGKVVCSGFGLVDKSESKWSGKPEYQLVGFAQTRAVSRALRNCLSWMVKAAGFSTTPAEEMYGVTPEKRGKMSSYRTFMPPMQSSKSEDTGFIFDRPEYQKAAPSAPESPVSTTQKENAEEIEETLRQMKAKAMANKIVIKSPDFMKEIDKALVGTDTDLQLSILKSAVMYMDENNIILQTPRYMSKLRKVANQEPF